MEKKSILDKIKDLVDVKDIDNDKVFVDVNNSTVNINIYVNTKEKNG